MYLASTGMPESCNFHSPGKNLTKHPVTLASPTGKNWYHYMEIEIW